MLKYIIFILVFNILCSAENFDIFENSDHKPADNEQAKRQLSPESRDVVVKNPHEPPQNAASNKQQNTDSVKKDLTKKDESVAVSSQNTANKNDDQNTNTSKDDSKDKAKSKEDNSTSASQAEGEKIETINVSGTNESNSTNSNPKIKNIKHAATEHPGAALRGFYVFLGLSVLIVIYFLFKAFRLRPGAPPPATVRKYGVVGRRSDMEMLPLPLAEEDDDDTLFDMGTQIHR